MKKQKFLAFALSLSLSTIPLSAPLALAEDTTVTGQTTTNTTTTSSTDTPSTTTDTTTSSTDTPSTATDTTATTSSDWLTQLINKLQTILSANSTAQTDSTGEQTSETTTTTTTTQTDATLESGDTQETQVTLNGNTKNLLDAQAFLAGLTATDSETMQKLELAISKTPAKNIKTLAGLLDKLPSQASEKVAINIVRSMEKSIAKMDKKEQHKTTNETTTTTDETTTTTDNNEEAILSTEEQSVLTEEEKAALNTLDQTFVSESLTGNQAKTKENKISKQGNTASSHQSSNKSGGHGSRGRR